MTLLLGQSVDAQQQKAISIGTGGTGGVYYPLGGGMANVLSKYLPGVQATAEVTGGSVDNLKLIGAGRSEVGMSMVDAALEALQGTDKFKSGKIPVRTLLVMYPNRMHVVSTAARGVTKMSELKGKRVSTGSPGSATEVMAFRVIEAAGLDRDKDMTRERLSVAESGNALKDGKIDAFFWVGGLPTAAVTDVGATPNVKIALVDTADLVEKMNAKYTEIYSKGVIPAKTYPGQDKDNSVAVVQNILVASASMPDDVAYAIVKTLMEKKPACCCAPRGRELLGGESAEAELTRSVPPRGREVLQREGREALIGTNRPKLGKRPRAARGAFHFAT
jgi:TRAP transporter TAXI family solute receptor